MIERFELPREEAIAFMKEKDEPYKVELIEDLPKRRGDQFLSSGRFHRSLRRSAPDERKKY